MCVGAPICCIRVSHAAWSASSNASPGGNSGQLMLEPSGASGTAVALRYAATCSGVAPSPGTTRAGALAPTIFFVSTNALAREGPTSVQSCPLKDSSDLSWAKGANSPMRPARQSRAAVVVAAAVVLVVVSSVVVSATLVLAFLPPQLRAPPQDEENQGHRPRALERL